MTLVRTASSSVATPVQVTLANGDTVDFLQVHEVQLEGGALIIYGLGRKLLVAFGPGAWLEIQPG